MMEQVSNISDVDPNCPLFSIMTSTVYFLGSFRTSIDLRNSIRQTLLRVDGRIG
jgi:hypothetical protein